MWCTAEVASSRGCFRNELFDLRIVTDNNWMCRLSVYSPVNIWACPFGACEITCRIILAFAVQTELLSPSFHNQYNQHLSHLSSLCLLKQGKEACSNFPVGKHGLKQRAMPSYCVGSLIMYCMSARRLMSRAPSGLAKCSFSFEAFMIISIAVQAPRRPQRRQCIPSQPIHIQLKYLALHISDGQKSLYTCRAVFGLFFRWYLVHRPGYGGVLFLQQRQRLLYVLYQSRALYL